MNLFIDFQCFKTEGNKFILKEFAAFNGIQLCHYVFLPPFNFNKLSSEYQKQANWLMFNHHCLLWDDGFVPLHKAPSLIQNLTSKADLIFIKGNEKVNFIKEFTNTPVLELNEQPTIKPSEAKCFYHKKLICICALSNVLKIYEQNKENIC